MLNYRTRNNALTYIILTTAAIVLTFPLAWLLLTSVKAEHEYVLDSLQIFPEVIRWDNYVRAVTMINFRLYALNSVFLSTLFATLTVLTSGMAGYAFARIPAPGRTRLFAIVVALIMIPTSIYLIPQFVLFARLKFLIRSFMDYWAYTPWLLWALAASPFHIFLFRQFFSAFPQELEEAAEVDGAGILRTFFQIVVPNALPVIATSFILNFLVVWGDWFLPLLYLTDSQTTLAVKLITAYVDRQGNALVTPTLAASVIYSIPPIIMFFLIQRYIMQGVVTSGLKG